MAQVISFQELLRSHAVSESNVPETIGVETYETSPHSIDAPLPSKEDIYRAILLLDLAAQHARLLVKKIRELSQRDGFEAQIVIIEQLLQVARQLASKL